MATEEMTSEEFEERRNRISQQIGAERLEERKQYGSAATEYRSLGNLEKTAECLARTPRTLVDSEELARRMGRNAWRGMYRGLMREAAEIYEGLEMQKEAEKVYSKIERVDSWLK